MSEASKSQKSQEGTTDEPQPHDTSRPRKVAFRADGGPSAAPAAGREGGGADGSDALVDDAKVVATHLAADAKDAVVKLAGDAKSALEKRLETGKDQAAKAVGEVAGVLRRGVDGGEGRAVPELAEKAASRIDSAAAYVRSRTLGDLALDAERLARREPLLFIGGSFALGFVGARFLKSSAARSEPAGVARRNAGRDDDGRRSSASADDPRARRA